MQPSCAFVIFGITSNLAQLKLIPALYDLVEKKLLSPESVIIGVGRRTLSESDFREYVGKVLRAPNKHHSHAIDTNIEGQLLKQMVYVSGDVDDSKPESAFPKISQIFQSRGNACDNHLFYLATYPSLYEHIFSALKKHEMTSKDRGWVRIMVEKPFGNDLLSAKKLDHLLHQYFSEDQIYRLDHYLGKETLQNILAFRFGNGIFEPLINAQNLDHIQITAAEDFGVGQRGEYYDMVGALRDVGQNHQVQMLAFATMEAPATFSAQAISSERVKILSVLDANPVKVVLGQYEGYHQESHVKPGSSTETYYAFKTMIQNERFNGVPVYVRGGKQLARTVTEINLVFKTPQNNLFDDLKGQETPNILVYRIQPNEGIGLRFYAKNPGHKVSLSPAYMDYCYRRSSGDDLPDAYEKLIYAAMTGDQTFFNSSEEVEAQWAFVDNLLTQKHTVHTYEQGGWGPKAADTLLEADGRAWIEPSEALCKI